MGEENNSWIMRTKFSHTVFHRMDSLKFPAIDIPNPSRHDALGHKVASSSLPSLVDPLELWNKSKEQELKHKEQTVSPVPASRSESSTVNKGLVTSLNNEEQNLKHNQSNGVPYLPTFSAESSSSSLDSERSAFYLSGKEKNSKASQKFKSPPPAKLTAGTNHSGFDFQMPIPIMSPKVQNSKLKRREQSPNFQRSSSIAVCENKSIQPNRRDPSPFPVKYISSRSVGHNSNREGQKLESKGRVLSPHPSTALSEEFKLARSDTKRFSTPIPRRKEDEMVNIKKMLSRDSEKVRSRKDNTWTRYFNHSGGKVSAVDVTEECRIDLSELYLGDRFAIGANSRLYHGVYNSQSVAVKIIILPDDLEDDLEDDLAKRVRLEKQFTGEVALLSNLHHRNVLKLVGAFKNPPSLCILTEYLSGGSLRAFLHKPENRKLPLQKLVEVSLGIARGLEYIHSKGIVHRDLKPENILFDKDGCVKIADFGIACEETYCDILADDPGTYRFMAPEMIKKKPHGRKVDVYSFGLVLWEMLTGSVPFEDMIPYQAAFAVVDKNLRPPIPPDCPPPLRILIEQCWTLHSSKRPESSQIVKVLEHFESALVKDGTLNSITDTSNHESNRWFQNHNRSQKVKSSSTNVANQTMPKLL